MPIKPSLRIDLGELDPYFERLASAEGRSVEDVLREDLTRFVAGPPALPKNRVKRTRRFITFASAEEKQRASQRAKDADQPLSAAVRGVAIDRLFGQVRGGGPSMGVALVGGGTGTVAGLGESPTERLELRLNPSELASLEEKARIGGYRSTQALVIAVTRAFLLNAPVLDPGVVAALGQQNLELVHISNSVRQLVRDLEARKRLGLMETFDVVDMLRRLDAHIEVVGKALALAQGRWAIQGRTA